MDKELLLKVSNALDNVRRTNPLVHSITNYVTVNDCANILLAIGASPIMADDLKECADITSLSKALVINIGTLNERTIESMIVSGKKANELGIPVIFDPVGAGASAFRNETAKRIINEVKISVIRGNMSEIKFISGLSCKNKGVDVSENDEQSDDKEKIKIAKELAVKLDCSIAITGVKDFISDGKRCVVLENGTRLLSKVTGTGCMTSALIGAYLGAGNDSFISAVSGVISMGICGEVSFEKNDTVGTGSFRVGIIDAISKLDDEVIINRGKYYEA